MFHFRMTDIICSLPPIISATRYHSLTNNTELTVSLGGDSLPFVFSAWSLVESLYISSVAYPCVKSYGLLILTISAIVSQRGCSIWLTSVHIWLFVLSFFGMYI